MEKDYKLVGLPTKKEIEQEKLYGEIKPLMLFGIIGGIGILIAWYLGRRRL